MAEELVLLVDRVGYVQLRAVSRGIDASTAIAEMSVLTAAARASGRRAPGAGRHDPRQPGMAVGSGP